MRELFVMHAAYLRRTRANLLDQASLVAVAIFGGSTSEQLAEYVETGRLESTPDRNGDDYDGEAMKDAVENARGRLGILRNR